MLRELIALPGSLAGFEGMERERQETGGKEREGRGGAELGKEKGRERGGREESFMNYILPI